jgi:hypothetical protein
MSMLHADSDLFTVWQDATWLQAQRFALPMSQYDNVTSNAPHKVLAAELQGTWEMKMKSSLWHDSANTTVQEMREEEGNFPAFQRQNPDFEHLQKRIRQAEDSVDVAMDSVAT